MTPSKNSGYAAKDIERYHSGTMPAQERHALEKAALDDPFLADALEGYTFTNSAAADLSAIRERLEQQEGRQKVVPVFTRYRWLTAAAVTIMLAGTGWFAFKTFTGEKDSFAVTPGSETREKVAPSPRLPNSDTVAATKETTIDNTQKIKEQKGTLNLSPAQNSTTVSRPVQEEMDHATSPVTQNMETKKEQANASTLSRPPVELNRSVTQNNSEAYTNNAARNRMVNPDPGVNNAPAVFRKQRFYKDADSNTPTAAAQRVGGVDKQDTIRNFNVVLQPERNDSIEVVVVGYGAAKKAATPYPHVIIDTLEPAEGYMNFDYYVARNLKMPEDVRTKSISGEVQLSFDVDQNGQPVNITVVKSLCGKCDEEAIRLLKEGPKWKKKKNQRGRITIRF